MQQIRIIGSTELGWHRVDELNADALMRFASVEGAHFARVLPEGVVWAPRTFNGFAKCGECPFDYGDATQVLTMIRPMLLEAEDERQTHNRIK